MEEPDYDSYNLAELQQVYHRIDRMRFPDRFKKIEEILNDPKKVEELRQKKSSHDDIEPLFQILSRKVKSYPEKNTLRASAWTFVGISVFMVLFFFWGRIPLRNITLYADQQTTLYWLVMGGMGLVASKYLAIAIYHIRKNNKEK